MRHRGIALPPGLPWGVLEEVCPQFSMGAYAEV